LTSRLGAQEDRFAEYERQIQALVSHYLFEAEFCNPASGWEKGQVEKNVRDARHRLWQPVPAFPSLGALNDWLEQRCKALWSEISHGKLPGTVADVWAQEKPYLMPVTRPFDGFVERIAGFVYKGQLHPRIDGAVPARALQLEVRQWHHCHNAERLGNPTVGCWGELTFVLCQACLRRPLRPHHLPGERPHNCVED
jgi:hypothetical protein